MDQNGVTAYLYSAEKVILLKLKVTYIIIIFFQKGFKW